MDGSDDIYKFCDLGIFLVDMVNTMKSSRRAGLVVRHITRLLTLDFSQLTELISMLPASSAGFACPKTQRCPDRDTGPACSDA